MRGVLGTRQIISQNDVHSLLHRVFPQPMSSRRNKPHHVQKSTRVRTRNVQSSGHKGMKKCTRLVALVAHNQTKPMMMNFVANNLDFFKRVSILTTGSTGSALENKLGLHIARKVASGPLGGDQEIGGMVTNGEVAAAFFFVDPLSSHPHDADIHALTRIFEVHNVLCATNLVTGEALVYALKTSRRFRQMLSKHRVVRRESEVVASYKAQQQKVVNALAK